MSNINPQPPLGSLRPPPERPPARPPPSSSKEVTVTLGGTSHRVASLSKVVAATTPQLPTKPLMPEEEDGYASEEEEAPHYVNETAMSEEENYVSFEPAAPNVNPNHFTPPRGATLTVLTATDRQILGGKALTREGKPLKDEYPSCYKQGYGTRGDPTWLSLCSSLKDSVSGYPKYERSLMSTPKNFHINYLGSRILENGDIEYLASAMIGDFSRADAACFIVRLPSQGNPKPPATQTTTETSPQKVSKKLDLGVVNIELKGDTLTIRGDISAGPKEAPLISLKNRDTITKINGQLIKGKSPQAIRELLQKAKSIESITVVRQGGETLTLNSENTTFAPPLLGEVVSSSTHQTHEPPPLKGWKMTKAISGLGTDHSPKTTTTLFQFGETTIQFGRRTPADEEDVLIVLSAPRGDDFALNYGDRIEKINGRPIKGKTPEEILKLLNDAKSIIVKTKNGTNLALTSTNNAKFPFKQGGVVNTAALVGVAALDALKQKTET